MSNFTGMNIEEVRNLAIQFGQRADEIDQLCTQLDSQLRNTAWVGPDQQRFMGEWDGQYARNLALVAQGLRQAQTDATRNANEQQSASQ